MTTLIVDCVRCIMHEIQTGSLASVIGDPLRSAEERRVMLIVRGISRWLFMEQELFCVIGLDPLKGLDWLIVIEAVRKIVGGHVTRTQIRKSKILFNERKKAARLVDLVRNVVVAGIRGNDEKRDTKAKTHFIDLRRIDMVIPAAPIIPRDKDRRGIPELTGADFIYDGRNPIGSFVS